jgi:all-trans-retinol 13,14-reductase
MRGAANRRVVVIGGGMSGMASAVMLGKHGCRVTLVEKSSCLGPTLRGFSRSGVHFETGLHHLGGLSPEGLLTLYFRLLGLEDLPTELLRQDSFDRVVFADSGLEIRLAADYDALQASLCAHFPDDAAFIKAYLKDLRKTYEDTAFLDFSQGLRRVPHSPERNESLTAVLEKGGAGMPLRTVLSIHCFLHGVSPDDVAFRHHARVSGSYLSGVKTVSGGGRVLVEALARRLREEHVTTLCNAVVGGITVAEDNAVSGVTLADGDYLPADDIIYTAHPALLAPMLPPGSVKPAFLRRLSSLKDSICTHSIFAETKQPIAALDGSNLFLCLTPDIRKGFAPNCVPEEGPFYISGVIRGDTQSILIFSPGAMATYERWSNSRPGNRPEAYRRFKAERLAAVWDAVRRAYPELARAEVVDGGTPLTNRDFLASPGGGLYGAGHSISQFNPLPITKISHLWLAGQSVVAPGILGTAVSAIVASGLVLGMDVVHKEVCACA